MLTAAFHLGLLALTLVTGAYIGARWAYTGLRIESDISRYLCSSGLESPNPPNSSASDAAQAGAGSADGPRPAPSTPPTGAGRGSPTSIPTTTSK